MITLVSVCTRGLALANRTKAETVTGNHFNVTEIECKIYAITIEFTIVFFAVTGIKLFYRYIVNGNLTACILSLILHTLNRLKRLPVSLRAKGKEKLKRNQPFSRYF